MSDEKKPIRLSDLRNRPQGKATCLTCGCRHFIRADLSDKRHCRHCGTPAN
ncbi:MAG: hypothetical protein IID44_29895 [Planctomycetes bacterium]|nr:hypothetical protein [Planctomycetota bacterium]